MTCLDCGNAIEEGRQDRAPDSAKFCLKCRSGRRRRHNLKYHWLPHHEPTQLAVCLPNRCFSDQRSKSSKVKVGMGTPEVLCPSVAAKARSIAEAATGPN